jgi:hypothetical protein
MARKSRELVSCEMVDSQQRHMHESRRISIVGDHYRATPSEDIEAFMCAAELLYVECVDP